MWIALVLSVSACSRHEGRPIPQFDVKTFTEGKTTERDVLQKLGPPEKKEKLLGEEVWIYRHIVHTGFGKRTTQIRVVKLRFDDKGVLQHIEETNRKYESLF